MSVNIYIKKAFYTQGFDYFFETVTDLKEYLKHGQTTGNQYLAVIK